MNAADKIAVSILRIRHRLPFFGALALFAEHCLDPGVPTAATDGRVVLFNPGFVERLCEAELDAVMVHELLHAALLHCPRLGERDPKVWNIAADIVVNGIIRTEPELHLPGGACVDPRLENFEVEEVYKLLMAQLPRVKNEWLAGDLLPADSKSLCRDANPWEAVGISAVPGLEAYWKQALQQASVLAQGAGRGRVSAALSRWIHNVSAPEFDWRSLLWRFLVHTPVDFSGFDRRLVGRGLYLEALEGDRISVRIAVDTSGSVESADLERFLSEVRGIVRMYPHLDAQLFYADSKLFGPFELNEGSLEAPIGGGGTSFAPFFKHFRGTCDPGGNTLLIYLTDGYGSFPNFIPEQPVLWVVTAGGRSTEAFPFGEVARLRE